MWNKWYLHIEGIIQMLLSGTDVVQMVRTLYKNEPSDIAQVLAELETWMDEKGYKSISEFKGKLSDYVINSTDVYHRAQYLDFFLT